MVSRENNQSLNKEMGVGLLSCPRLSDLPTISLIGLKRRLSVVTYYGGRLQQRGAAPSIEKICNLTQLSKKGSCLRR